MSEHRDNLALWLAHSLYHGIDEYVGDEWGGREEDLFKALQLITDSEYPINDIHDLEDITLTELRAVVMFLRLSRHPAFHEERVKLVLKLTLGAIDAAIAFTGNSVGDSADKTTQTAADGNESNKRKRTE